MLAALPRTDYGHPAVGALIYLVIVAVLVGSAVVVTRRGRSKPGSGPGRRPRHPPRRRPPPR
jgi:hypothetical protein